MGFRKFDRNLYHLSGPNAGVVIAPGIDVMNGDDRTLSVGSSGAGSSRQWVRWGKDDNEPNVIAALNWDSPSKPSLQDQAKEFVLGQGVAPFRVKYENGKKFFEREAFEDLDDWFEENEIFEKYLELGALSLIFSEMAFVNYSIGEGNRVGLQTIQPIKCRFAKPAAGQPISQVLINPFFGTDKVKADDSVGLPVFDRKQPSKYAESIMVLRKAQIGQDFYTMGLFWGTKIWTKVANLIPQFHLNGLTNGYNIKYLIEIDECYFILAGENPDDEAVRKAIEARKDKFMDKLDGFLAGVENADKAIVMINKLTDDTGKPRDMIRVKPVDNKMSDDAYTKIYTAANIAQAQGHGILPALAGIEQGGKLGGSGSELEHAAMYQVAYRTPSYRRHLLKPLNMALRQMGYSRDIEYKFVDIEFTTLDKNPTGQQNVIGQAS